MVFNQSMINSERHEEVKKVEKSGDVAKKERRCGSPG